jgi:putative ABC transport system permease protein
MRLLVPAASIRHSVRALRRRPAFTAGTILTLALVIGASTALFSALYGLVFRRLPYDNPGRLVMLWDANRKTGLEHMPVMTGAFPIFERQARSFEAMAAYAGPSPKTDMFASRLWGTEERIATASCSPQFFAVLRTVPLVGRPFVAADATYGSAHVAILDYDFWRQHYGASADAVGKTLSLNFAGERHDYTIVGVMPEGFAFPFPLVPQKPDIWFNLRYPEQTYLGGNSFNVVGRLKEGVSLLQAQTEIDAIARRIEADHPKDFAGERVGVVSLESELIRDVRTVLWVLLAAVGSLMLIGCANIGHLLLVRAVGQERDMALRAALGAGRADLIADALVEIALLALAGGILGLLLANWGVRAFLALLPLSLYIPRFSVVALDWRVLAVAAAVSIGVTVCFGLLPSVRLLRPDLNRLLKPGSGAGRRGSSVFGRPGSILLVSEVCLTLVLLTGTVMLTRSLGALVATNVRFQPEHLLTVNISFSNAAVQSLPDFSQAKITLYDEFTERVAAMSGVGSVAAAEAFPLSTHPLSFKADGGGGAIAEADQPAELHVVTPNFFETMATPLVGGRWLADSDVPNSQPVVVINETMARRYWPG